MKKSWKHPPRKRPFLLLEVVIAIALVALCALPLISPLGYMLRTQQQFVHTVELNHLSHQLFVQVLENLYSNSYEWELFENKEHREISELLVGKDKDIALPANIQGYYFFEIAKSKVPKTDKTIKIVLLTIHLHFETPDFRTQKGKMRSYTYSYQTVLMRDLKGKVFEDTGEEEDEVLEYDDEEDEEEEKE